MRKFRVLVEIVDGDKYIREETTVEVEEIKDIGVTLKESFGNRLLVFEILEEIKDGE